jgi:hypothetical protein
MYEVKVKTASSVLIKSDNLEYPYDMDYKYSYLRSIPSFSNWVSSVPGAVVGLLKRIRLKSFLRVCFAFLNTYKLCATAFKKYFICLSKIWNRGAED